MRETTKFLCKEIMGVRFAFTQSDEISLVLTDYNKIDTQAWFDGNVQKLVSLSASMATAKFNELRHKRGIQKLAFFDSRAFTIPEEEEVINYFLWRQRDCEKNSISMVAQSLYPHKELHKINTSDMQELCFQKGVNWNDLDSHLKRGSFVTKQLFINKRAFSSRTKQFEKFGSETTIYNDDYDYSDESLEFELTNKKLTEFKEDSFESLEVNQIRNSWVILDETPYFGKDREYIKRLLKGGY